MYAKVPRRDEGKKCQKRIVVRQVKGLKVWKNMGKHGSMGRPRVREAAAAPPSDERPWPRGRVAASLSKRRVRGVWAGEFESFACVRWNTRHGALVHRVHHSDW